MRLYIIQMACLIVQQGKPRTLLVSQLKHYFDYECRHPPNPEPVTEIYKNLPWIYSLLKDEPAGTYYLEVVCGTIGWYEVYLRLTQAKVAAFLLAVAAGQPDALNALAKQVLHDGGQGIPGREYLRETHPERPQS